MDNRVTIQVELTDEEWYELMKMAHERDITLNQMVELILREFIERERQK
jgi:predicted DNA-binding ribbon-helix-helix protein